MGLCDLADELVEPLFSIKQDLAKTIYIHYASERDKNEQLQQENQQLKEDINFCLHSIKQEMEMSIDSRTRKEMKTCYEILKGDKE